MSIDPLREALEAELEGYKKFMGWPERSSGYEKTLVLGNLNGFVGYLMRPGGLTDRLEEPAKQQLADLIMQAHRDFFANVGETPVGHL